MTARRVFLTGASGNVGAAVCAELLERGDEVVALVRKSMMPMAGCRPFFGDLAKIRDAAAEILQADHVIHCASPRSDERSRALREDIEGTAHLLDLWQAGTFVFASSQTVYGVTRDVMRESAAVSASGWYDLAKICNEQQVQMTGSTGRRGAGVSLRLPLVFAAGPRRHDRQYLPQLADALRAGKRFLFGSEEGMAAFGSVFIGEADIGRAMADATAVQASGPYNVAGGFCTWRELLTELGRQFGIAPQWVVREGAVAQEGEFRVPQSRSFYDCGRFETASGFRPRQSLSEVIELYVRAEMRESIRPSP